MNASDKAKLNLLGVPNNSAGGSLGDPSRGVGDIIESAISANNNAFTPSTGTLTVTGDVTASGTVTGTTAISGGSITATTGDITSADDFETAALAGRLNFTNATSGATNIAEIRSSAANAAGTVALRLSAGADLTTSGAKLLSIGDNAATSYAEKLSVDKDGNIYFTADNQGLFSATAEAGIQFGENGSGEVNIYTTDAGIGVDSAGVVYLTGTSVTRNLGTGSGTSSLIGLITANPTDVGNVGAGTDTLITYTLPSNALVAAGRGLRITAYGTTANNANAKTITLDFGSQTVMTQAMTVNEANTWEIEATVLRTGTSTQDVMARLTQLTGTALRKGTITAGTQTETSTIIIKLTGTATTDNDIVCGGLIVEAL